MISKAKFPNVLLVNREKDHVLASIIAFHCERCALQNQKLRQIRFCHSRSCSDTSHKPSELRIFLKRNKTKHTIKRIRTGSSMFQALGRMIRRALFSPIARVWPEKYKKKHHDNQPQRVTPISPIENQPSDLHNERPARL